MEQTVFLDECGFTGEDLAQPDQPVFVVASHNLTEDEASALKEQHFGHVKAEELKHSSLQRREQHHAAVTALLDAVLTSDRARASMAYKPYALIAKIVDHLIEPMMFEDGLDLYDQGGHDALAAVLYYSLGAHSKKLLFDVGSAFQRAVRTRAPEHVRACNTVLSSADVGGALDGLPNFFRIAIAKYGVNWTEDLPDRCLDLSLPLALQQCWAWRRRLSPPFNIVHDRSSPMVKSKWLWDALLAPDAPAAVVGRGGATVEYPIGVTATRFEDSKHSAALQIADVVAGAVGRWATWVVGGAPESDRYASALDAVIEPALGQLIASAIWPTPSVAKGAPRAPGVMEPNDYVASVITKTRSA